MRRVRLARDSNPSQPDRELLARLGFARFTAVATLFGPGTGYRTELTEDGAAFDEAANVEHNRREAERVLRQAYLRFPATQALIQGLHGRGSIPVTGAHYMLARHGYADPNDLPGFRNMLAKLRTLGVVSYSNKHQTVRVTAPLPETDEEATLVRVRVVEPDRPFSNLRHLRQLLRECKGFIWWVDPHFEKRGFEQLLEEADASKLKQIRILATKRPSPAEIGDYKRFKTEMTNVGIEVEYRIVPETDSQIHDRYIIDRDTAWNVPPLATILGKGKYSEFTRAQQRPPFETWWQKGKPVEELREHS